MSACRHAGCPPEGCSSRNPIVLPMAPPTHSPDYTSDRPGPEFLTPAHPSVIQAQRDAWKAEAEAAREALREEREHADRLAGGLRDLRAWDHPACTCPRVAGGPCARCRIDAALASHEARRGA